MTTLDKISLLSVLRRLTSTRPLLPLWLLTAALILYWMVPRMTEKGLFIDGLVYQNLAQNLAQGESAFWAPRLENNEFLFDKTGVFFDHPPLMFGIESVLFSLFGKAAVHIHTVLMVGGIVCAMLLIWTLMLPVSAKRSWLACIPLFLLFTIPEWAQKITYNLLDPALALWTTLAVYCVVKAFRYSTQALLWSSLCGVFILLAFCTKGPVGLFPVATPVLYYLFFRKNAIEQIPFKKLVYVYTGMLIILIAGTCILYFYPPSQHFFENYLRRQVMASMQGEREKASTLLNHLSIFKKMAIQLSPLLLLSMMTWWIWNKRTSSSSHISRTAWFLFTVGLSASMPIAISAKHHSFYLIPSFVFFALAFGVWIYHRWPTTTLSQKSSVSGWWNVLIATCIVTICIYSYARKERYYHSHRNVLKQIEQLEPYLIRNDTLLAPSEWVEDRGDLAGYLEYYFDIRLVSNGITSRAIDLSSHATTYNANQIIAETRDFILVQMY